MSIAERLMKELETPKFTEQFQAFTSKLADNSASEMDLINEAERLQIESLKSWGYEGNSTLQALKLAVKTYPDQDMSAKISRLCDVEERIISGASGKIKAFSGGPYTTHGHSHNGVPCPHSHSHSGPDPQTLMLMNMAAQSLTPEQQGTMRRLQMKMMQGQAPTEADRKAMLELNQHFVAYMATMRQVMQNVPGGVQPPAQPPAPPPKKS